MMRRTLGDFIKERLLLLVSLVENADINVNHLRKFGMTALSKHYMPLLNLLFSISVSLYLTLHFFGFCFVPSQCIGKL